MKSIIRCSSAAIRWMLTIMTIGSLSWFIISIRGEYFSIVLAQTEGARQQADASSLVGTWNLAYATNEEGGQRAGRGSITLEMRMVEGKLNGTAYVIGRGGEKHEWKLLTPVFDGKKFRFAVDNGEGVLDGELEYKAGAFEGKWKMVGTELNGTLKMTRKE